MIARRRLGPHGPHVRPIVLGTFGMGGWWWGGADPDEAVRAMQASFDEGVDAVDTAPVYGFGRAEELVGRALQGRRDDVVVCTKFGIDWQGERGTFYFEAADTDGRRYQIHKYCPPERIAEECEASLRRLGVDVIDLYQLHWPDPHVPPEDVMGACARLRDQGKIRAIGVSNCPVEWMARALEAGPLTCHQPKWSWLFRKQEPAIAWAAEHGLGSLTYSALEQGLLSGKLKPHQRWAPGDHRNRRAAFSARGIAKVNALLDRIRPIAHDRGCTVAQLVLASTLQVPGVTAAIVGARTVEHARDNAAAMRISLGQDEMDRIRQAFEAS